MPLPAWSHLTGRATFSARHMTSARTSFPISQQGGAWEAGPVGVPSLAWGHEKLTTVC